ncbi:winged-helix domain-containing protein [Halobaculum sp. EA56]|uniref:winged-helix domain-containing protein n=1 Tax=Halobaculum sp. EA56 TaxID=3421648 RepID=UPI003EBA1C82
MRARVDWMQYPGDDRILELLDESGMILSPAVIAANIDLSREYITRRLKALREHELVERVDTGRGHHQITQKGKKYLSGELDESCLK